MKGLQLTAILSLISIVFSFFFGIILALMRLSKKWFISYPATFYIEIVRATPLLMVIFWVFFMIPVVIGKHASPISAGLIAFVGFTSTYIAEIVRAGILSLPRGQMEASRATGLIYFQAMAYIILPQAVRNMWPVLVSRFITVFKDTSLVYIIGVVEFFRAAVIVNNRGSNLMRSLCLLQLFISYAVTPCP